MVESVAPPDQPKLSLTQRELIIDDLNFFRQRLETFLIKLRKNPKFADLLHSLEQIVKRLERGCRELSIAFKMSSTCRIVNTGSNAISQRDGGFMQWLRDIGELFSRRAKVVTDLGYQKAGAILFAIAQLINQQAQLKYHEGPMDETQDLNRLRMLAGLAANATPTNEAPHDLLASDRSNLLRELNDSAARAKRQSSKAINEVSPPGFKGTVKAMKNHKDIDNPYALGWYEKNKGDKSHYKADGKKKKESVKEDKPSRYDGDYAFRTKSGPTPSSSREDREADRAAAQERVKAKRQKPVEEAALTPGQHMRVTDGSGLGSGKTVTIISPQDFANGEKIDGWYESPVARGWVPIRMPDGKVSKMPHNRLQPAQRMESRPVRESKAKMKAEIKKRKAK